MRNDALRAALEALEIGHAAASELAARFHAEMAGYKPERHAAVDADVEKINKAMTRVSAALAQPEPEPEPVAIGHDSRILHELAGAASLCWEPNPTGVFNTEKAIGFVEDALKELRESAAPPPSAQRVPLTDEQIDDVASFVRLAWGKGAADWNAGVDALAAELKRRAHGITAPKEQK